MRDTHRERQRHRQREKQAPCREPDAGLDPQTGVTVRRPGLHFQPSLSYSTAAGDPASGSLHSGVSGRRRSSAELLAPSALTLSHGEATWLGIV